jgi:hypothetical protein
VRKQAANIQSWLQLMASTDRSTGKPLRSRMPYDYDAWNEEVIATVPADKLLVFAAKDGWKPLCEFLAPLSLTVEQNCRQVLESGEPYPRTNEKLMFQVVFFAIRAITAVTYALPAILAVALASSIRTKSMQKKKHE